jgi:ribosomal protein S18
METDLSKINPRKLTGEQIDQLRAEGKLIPVDLKDPEFLKKMFASGRPASQETLTEARKLGLIP